MSEANENLEVNRRPLRLFEAVRRPLARATRRGGWIGLLLASVLSSTASAAIVPAGSFVFDGSVSSIVHSGSDVFVGGSFTKQQMPTGGGLVLAGGGSGTPDPSQFPKVAGEVSAVAADGFGGWFIGGDFTHVGGQPRINLAHILVNGSVDAAWRADANDRVYALAVSGSTVFAGGDFLSVGGQPRRGLVALGAMTGNVTSWDPSPQGGSFRLVSSLAVSGSTLYLAGGFTSVDGQSRSGLAAVGIGTGTATAWNPDPGGGVETIAVSGSTVYVGGFLSSVGGQSRSGLAALDAATGNATAWNPSPDGSVYALAVSGPTVYAGGDFSSIGGQPRAGLAALDVTTGSATAWSPNPNSRTGAIAISGATVYAGGDFSSIGGQPRAGLAALDVTTGTPTAWNPNPNSRAGAIAVSASTVYAGGDFSGAGPPVSTVGRIAKLNATGDLDTSWNPNPTGGDGGMVGCAPCVNSLAVLGSTVYAGGAFATVGGQSRKNLAALDRATGIATAWDPGLSEFLPVSAIAASAATVYVAAGYFAPSDLRAFDASTGLATPWSSTVSPSDTGVFDLAVSGSTVYANGTFPSIGGQPRAGLAALNATTGATAAWDPNPSDGITHLVRTLAVSGSTVYTGGVFASIGGQPRNRLAALDATTGNASTWNPNVTGFGVLTLATAGPTIYAGGSFTTIGGQPRTNLAALDTLTGRAGAWNPNPNGVVTVLAASGATVYAAGGFSAVDGTVTGPFAVLTNSAAPPADTTAPSVTITTPTEGQHFAQGQAVNAVFSCNDGSGSGVQSCNGPATVATATVGTRQLTVTTSDVAGNSATKVVSYVVDAPPETTPVITTPPPPIGTPLPIGTPPPPPVDTTAPAATLTASAQKLRKAVSVRVSCPNEACTARTTASVPVPGVGATKAKTYKLKAVTAAIARGQAARIKLKLSAAAQTAIKRALRVGKRVVVKVKLIVTDAAGNKKTLTRQIKLKR